MADSTTSQADMSGGLSLLSLSIAAASASPIPVANNAPQSGVYNGQGSWNGSLPAGVNGSFHTNGHVKQHRRLSSTGQARRRLSDARDAAVRPSAATIQTAAAALSSLATLSISGAPPPASLPHSQGQGVFKLEASPSTTATPIPIPAGGEKEEQDTQSTDAPTSNSSGKPGKKRGTLYQCESCSKVYRHPSCLIKHRWEHSPQWREASKFVLSKHQQVQLLEVNFTLYVVNLNIHYPFHKGSGYTISPFALGFWGNIATRRSFSLAIIPFWRFAPPAVDNEYGCQWNLFSGQVCVFNSLFFLYRASHLKLSACETIHPIPVHRSTFARLYC
ncbi:hypothetical protein JAAARDRAFT_418499 [Jaapia argillacea MUCL 33604]|uniref:C2H2-type domain-containing protein n=1 Tax=Jaapia argillacea MUCL 33604 TaxID=933084 RepID=A0A067PGD1_9AGAM|nr:hypothetical protein JAAARDRAFT_418499 [Jaapia argillacea MUCL 33604]